MGLSETDPPVPRISVVTAFPNIVKGYLSSSILGKGIERGLLDVSVVDLRGFADGSYRQIDDYSYGGGGMVLMAAPLESALESAADGEDRYVIYPSPQGRPLCQELIEDLLSIASHRRLVFVCGHYEGVDERFVRKNVDMEISIGDFVITGGELPSLATIDAIARLVPGVVGSFDSVKEDSFFSGMLDNPHYTRPEDWGGDKVPDTLLSGDHAAINRYRRREAAGRTVSRRPELLAKAGIMPYLECGVYVLELHHPVLDRNGRKSTTAITGMDLHDIARACRTYGVRKFIVVTPLESQRELISEVVSHWITGYGAEFNPDRADAMKGIKTASSVSRALDWINGKEHRPPFVIAATARERTGSLSWLTLKETALRAERPVAFMFGTGSGLCEETLDSADAVMSPISGGQIYNHLSVRSAVSITLDRFFGFR
ncbi:MAG: tRNA (guanosine(37)-N1)-methyltransferase TrmD [Synergistaceae bacterium]|jgi:tRNA (guanine37-N1)-methyltransferase|nr:tRNA (guanosine(37)-N1)-methyltransferase TrmD [Synergistaceae bacterium]